MMKPDIHGKQMDVGAALRTYVEEKISNTDSKYFNHATACKVTFAREGHGHGLIKVTISYLVARNIVVNVENEAADAYVAFDQALEKTAKRLRRYKRKLRDHHERVEKSPESEMLKARDYVLALEAQRESALEQDNDDYPEEVQDPVVIAEMATHIETMSVSEAVMRLDLGGQSALLFRNSGTEGLNMVYRRPDGHIGWIDPAEKKAEKAA